MLAQDLVDAKSGEAVAEAGQKITPRLAKKLVEGGLKDVFVTNEQLVGSYISTDFINEETGEVICEAGDELTEELLETLVDPARFAPPAFHLLTGYTLIGAFFLATEDSSSPVNFIPMLIYGAAGGIMTVLIRNIGAWVDGVILAILVINLISPLLDKIRPEALGKVG